MKATSSIDTRPPAREEKPCCGSALKLATPPPELRAGPARRTASGKISFPVSVVQNGKTIGLVPVSSSLHGRKEAIKLLAKHLGDAEAEREVDRLTAEAHDTLEHQPQKTGPTLRDVVAEHAPKLHQLVYRTGRNAWCERHGGREVTKADVVGLVPPTLMEAAAMAADAPASRQALLRAVRAELEVWWSDKLETLPRAKDAQLQADSAAGQVWRAALLHLWTMLRNTEVDKDVSKDGSKRTETMRRSSLASLVLDASREYRLGRQRPASREYWHPLHRAQYAWWRPFRTKDGKVVIMLAMRFELCGQMNTCLPEVHDQDDLTELGIRYGCIDPNPPVTVKLSGGGSRAAVLTRTFIDEVLTMPDENEPSGSAPGATRAPVGAPGLGDSDDCVPEENSHE